MEKKDTAKKEKKSARHSTTVYIPRGDEQEAYLRAINVAAQLQCGVAKGLGKFSEFTNYLFRKHLKEKGLMNPDGRISVDKVLEAEKKIEEEKKNA